MKTTATWFIGAAIAFSGVVSFMRLVKEEARFRLQTDFRDLYMTESRYVKEAEEFYEKHGVSRIKFMEETRRRADAALGTNTPTLPPQ